MKTSHPPPLPIAPVRALAAAMLASAAFLLQLPMRATLEDNVVIANRTYTASATESAAQTLSTSGTVIISSGANVTFEAGGQIHLLPGFHAVAGSNFHAKIGLSDAQSPSAPANLAISNITDNSATITWTAPTDIGVAGYEILVDGAVTGTTSETNYTITGLVPSINHTVRVRAYDAAGNYSAEAIIVIALNAINTNTAQTSSQSKNPSQDIDNSQSSDMAQQDAHAVLNDLINFEINYTAKPLQGDYTETYNSGIGLAHGSITIYSHWEPVGQNGNLLSTPIGSNATGSTQSTNNSLQSTNTLREVLSSPDMTNTTQGIGGGMVLYQDITFIVTWPYATPPSVTIFPAASQTIHIGDSVTFTSVATHAEKELIKHNFEWQQPGGDQWINGAATVYPSGVVSAAPDSQFSPTTTSTRAVTFTPLMQGRYVFRFAAADKVAGFNYSPGVVVMVENTAPAHAVTFSAMTAYAGGPAIDITHTAWNPTSLPDYQIGIQILEQRVDSSGNVYQPWQLVNYQALAAGNRVYTGTRPPPDRPGRIIYHAYAWNQYGMSETDNVHEYVIEVPNRAPTIEWKEPLPTSVEYGQSFTIQARAQDADNNLESITMTINGAAPRIGNFTNGLLAGSQSDAVLDSDNSLKPDAGKYVYTAAAYDSESVASGQISHAVTVTKATPVGTFPSKSIAEGTALTATHLSAQFTNPNDGNNVNAASTITYVIQSGGSNGTEIKIGTILPLGTYTIRATFGATQNFNEATKDAQFTVESNPDVIKYPDGLTNAVKDALGLDPNAPAVNSPELLDVNIHTPTTENQ